MAFSNGSFGIMAPPLRCASTLVYCPDMTTPPVVASILQQEAFSLSVLVGMVQKAFVEGGYNLLPFCKNRGMQPLLIATKHRGRKLSRLPKARRSRSLDSFPARRYQQGGKGRWGVPLGERTAAARQYHRRLCQW